jgi:pheromone shutdown-related protein TraB
MGIKIIGTSHVSQESINNLRKEFQENCPDIVAVELDKQRAESLFSKEKEKVNFKIIFQVGLIGGIFALFGSYVQKKIGNMVGIKPGSEMKEALILANKHNSQIYLIDQQIQITLKQLSKCFTIKEIFRIFKELIKGVFSKKKTIKVDFSKVPKNELIDEMIKQIKIDYPNIYRVLIHDRNRYMVKKLLKIEKENPEKNILAVVGAGHKQEMDKMINLGKI